MFNGKPLQYTIDDWHDLPACRSNNDRQLHIHVADFKNDERLSGVRITVEHEVFGTVFSCIKGARGTIISEKSPEVISELTTQQILDELEKFGFLVTFAQWKTLPGNQVQYLMTLNTLKFDKIRLLNVWNAPNGLKEFKPKVVAFKIKYLPDWLQASYSPSETEFVKAINSGYAINISAISFDEKFSWDWLYNAVINIDDVIAVNAKSGAMS